MDILYKGIYVVDKVYNPRVFFLHRDEFTNTHTFELSPIYLIWIFLNEKKKPPFGCGR